MDNPKTVFKRKAGSSILIMLLLMLIIGLASVTDVFAQNASEPAQVELTPERADVSKFGLIAAAIAFGFGAIGAGIAIAHVGAAAMAAIGEKPEIASQALIFIALGEGLVIFGFITALMILGKI
ncbi:MAG: ATPase [Spirochaetales bacterium]|nr:ATPase [Spirochaetales bacterium]